MRDVILINRPLIKISGFHIPGRKWQPLNLLYIATSLNNFKIDTEIIDARAYEYSIEKIKEILKKEKPRIVLVASEPYDFYLCPNPSMKSFYNILDICKDLKIENIISIGPQATLFDEKLLKETNLKYIIKGDNPLIATKLIQDLINNNFTDYENLSYKNNNKIKLGDIKHLQNLDDLAVGDYGLLPMEKYGANMPEFPKKKFSILITSRGCPYQCKYCLKKSIGHQVRKMSLPRVKKELDKLIKEHNVETIYFLDDLFNFDNERVKKLCQLIKNEKYNIIWGCQTRTDRVDEKILKIMKDAGCFYISYGIESGSQAVINRCNKNLNLKQAEKIIKLTKKIGIQVHVNMMYGFPGETVKEFNESINFLIRYEKNSLASAIRFYPGCQYYEELIPNKSIKDMEEVSRSLKLSKLTHKDIDRGLAKLVLVRKIKNKQYNWRILYFLFKYLFPGLLAKIKTIF